MKAMNLVVISNCIYLNMQKDKYVYSKTNDPVTQTFIKGQWKIRITWEECIYRFKRSSALKSLITY